MRIVKLVLWFLFFATSAFAGQIIDVDTPPAGNIYGNDNDLDSTDNTVNIYTNNLNFGNHDVAGAYSATEDVVGNTVNINASNLSNMGNIYGGMLSSSNSGQIRVNNNIVNISENSNNEYGSIFGGNGGDNTDHNKVDMKSGVFSSVYGGYASLNSNIAIADSNSVFLSNVATSSDAAIIVGGKGLKATNNTVEIQSGNFEKLNYIAGGDVYGVSQNLEASGNTVFIASGNFIAGGIYGGYHVAVDAANEKALVKNNTVNISGGIFAGRKYSTAEIAGGYSKGGGDVIDNTVNISGNPDLSGFVLIGGYSASGAVSGNTLNLSTNISVLGAKGFDNYNFYVNGKNTLNAMLKSADTVDMNSTIVGLYLKDNADPLHKGDKVWLVENMSGEVIKNGKLRAGVSLIYDWVPLIKDNNLYAVIGGSGGDNGGAGNSLNPEIKSLLEGRLSSMGVLMQGADLVAESGVSTADSTILYDSAGVFSGSDFSSIRLNSGSHIDINNTSFMLGMGRKINSHLIGVFLEYGSAQHSTYNEFSDSTVKGSGNNSYFGAGLLGKIYFSDNMYLDASLRSGHVNTDYTADYSVSAKYNIGSSYYGGHFGVGYIHNVNVLTFNEYVRYVATTQSSKNFEFDSNDEISFAAMRSSRVVAGIRSIYSGVFVGVAHSQELAGIANAETFGRAIDAPSIKGGTNIAEAGFDKTYSKVNVGFGVKGYMGVKDGYSLNVKVGYIF